MNQLYHLLCQGRYLWGIVACLSLLGTLQAQVPSCGPNQILTGYFSGATAVNATTGTVTTGANATGAADGTLAVLGASSSMTLDMGSVFAAGNSLNITYNSANVTAPLQVLVSSSAAGPFTNIAQLAASTSLTTANLLLPISTQYVRLATTSTGYSIDAVAYPIYKCVNNPAPTCAQGQTLMSYPSGSQGVSSTTGTVTNSTNATGVSDGAVATINTNGKIILNFGSVVTAGNVVSFTYYSQYTSTNATPMQVLVATTAAGPYTQVGSIQPSSAATSTTASITLPLDAQFVQLVTSGTYSTYYVDAVTYPLYACVTPPSTACSSGQQSVFYNAGVQGVNTTTGTVTNSTNITGVADGTLAALAANSSLTIDMGAALTAGRSLSFTYNSANTTAPMQIWTSPSLGGPYTYVGSVNGSTSATSTTVMLPLTAQYVRMVTAATAYNVDAVTTPVYSCVITPNTTCPAGQVSLSTRTGATGLNTTTGTVTNATNITGAVDGAVAAIAVNSSLTLDMGAAIAAGNQLSLTYSSANTTAPLQVLVAPNFGGPYTNIAQLPGSTATTTQSVVLPVSARYVQLATTGTAYSPDAVTQTLYSCVANPAVCPAGQTAANYPAGATAINTTTGTVTNGVNATGVADGTVATINTNGTMTLDLGSVVAPANVLTFTYYSQYTSTYATPMQVWVATTASGTYTQIGTIQPSTAASPSTASITLPVGAQFVKLVTAGTYSTYYVDAVTYKVYTCYTPPSGVTCTTGQQSVSYASGAIGIGATTGTVGSATNATGVADGALAALAASSSMNVDLGSSLPAGSVLTFSYSSANTTAPLQVWVATASGGPYSYIGSLNGSTSLTTNNLTLPLAAQYIQFKTSGTAYNLDAVTYPLTACVSSPIPQCTTAQTLVGYLQGAVGTNTTTGTVTSATAVTGNIDAASAALAANSSLTIDMGSTVTAGNVLYLTYNSANTTAPVQILTATNLGGPYTNVAQLPGSTTIQTESFTLPLDTRYVKLQTSGTAYNVDAVTYPVYNCVAKPATSCPSGQISVSYPSGATGVGTTTGTVTNSTNATANQNGTLAAMSANSSLILNMGSSIAAGNSIDITYNSGNTTAPLQVLVAPAAGGPYTNIAQLPGGTSLQTASVVLPLAAQYVQLQTTGTAYNIDAVTQTISSCVNSPITSCPAGQSSGSYQGGIQGTGTTTGTVTNPTNINGVVDGSVTAFAANSSLITNLGSSLPAGTTLSLTYTAGNTSAPLQVLVSNSATGPFTNIGSLIASTTLTTQPLTLPVAAQYVQLLTTATTYSVDALTYPVYTCVTPPSTGCGTGQLSVSYASGAQGLNNTTGTVTNSTNLTGSPDGATAAFAANSSATIDLGAVITGGNTLNITYSSNNTTAPLQVLVATNLGGPYTNVAQLPGSITTTSQSIVLPVDAHYVQLKNTATTYNVDAVTYTVYNCVADPANICSPGQQVISYNAGATGVNNATSVTNPSNATGTPDGALAVMAANGILTVDLGSVAAAGSTLSVNYKSGDLVAPLQVLVATNLGGPYTNIGQLPASTTTVTNALTLPVGAQYVQLQSKSTTYSIDAVLRPVYTCITSTTTSGVVYLDGNINGIHNSTEQGVGGVTIKAYDASGNLVATTTTSYGNPSLNIPAGYYSFSTLAGGQPYRLEFDGIPSQFSASIYGNDNGTSVQFIQGVTQGNDFGVYVPSTICSISNENPRMVTAKGLTGGANSVDSYNYYDRSKNNTSAINASSVTHDITYTQVGTPLGLASQRPTNLVYMSSITTNMPSVFPKAPDGSSAIYIANYNAPNGTQSYQNAKLLVKLSDLGINVGSGSDFGINGLGGLAFSESGDTLYVVNMYDGTLVQVDVSSVNYASLPTTKPTSATALTPPSSLSNCSGGVYRPTALTQYSGKIYMGGVCDAEISKSNADLKGVVLAYDPASQTWSKALDYPIDFKAGTSLYGASGQAQGGWFTTAAIQPVMLDLAFADNGEMVIGTTNRLVYNAATSSSQHGYIMGAWPNGDGTYTLENGGKLGPYTTTAPNTATGSDGPGGKWFFQQADLVNGYAHEYAYEGGLYIKSGTNEVVWGGTDPVTWYSYGAYYSSLTTGNVLYYSVLGSGQKLSRITGTDQVCDAAPPIEIGNRVWKDLDKDGIQDADEPSLAGVTVELRDASGTLIASAVTDANGNYIFSNQAGLANTTSQKYGLPITQNTNYTLTIPSLGSDPSTVGVVLTGISPAPGETVGSTNTGSTVNNNDAFLINGKPTISLTTGPDGTINHSYDFGFTNDLGSIGDYVWKDQNNNGIQDVGEPAVAGVIVQLLSNTGTVLATDTTDVNGVYGFPNLASGTYQVKILTSSLPVGCVLSSKKDQGTDDHKDSDFDPTTGLSQLVTINATGNGLAKDNPTIDAGLYSPKFDLALKKILASGQAASVTPGSTVKFTIKVYNQGDVDATAIQVSDYIPTGLTLADANWTVSNGTATLNTPIASLTAGDSTTRDITFTVNAGFTGSATNTAEISSAKDNNGNTPTDVDSTPDNNPNNDGTPKNDVTNENGKTGGDEDDHDPEVINVTPTPVFDLALKKTLATGQAASVTPGSTVKFTVTVYNQGNVDATDIQVSDYIPTGLTLADANWTVSNGIATLVTPIASLATGANTTRDITFTVNAGFTGSATNTAEISSAKDNNGNTPTDVDSTPDNNPNNDGTPKNDVTNENGKTGGDEDDHDPEVINVTPTPVFDLALKKTLATGQSSSVTPGSTVKFTITVYNQGNVDATDIQVSDYIPTGLTLADANWKVSNGIATLNTPIASLAAGASTTRDITFTVNTGVTGALTNTAEILSAKDANGNTPTDIDSTPDNNPNNDGTPKNDVTYENGKTGGDEDDSDPEVINILCIKPVLTVGNVVCSGTTYSVVFYSSTATVTASAGTVGNGIITSIPVGTNVTITATQTSGCTSVETVTAPVTCPIACTLPQLTLGQPLCNGTTYSISFTATAAATITASAGTVGTNVITGIPVGTDVTVTATTDAANGCISRVTVKTPASCSDPCENPGISLSGPLCSNSTTYSLNYTLTGSASVTASAGTVSNGSITGIPMGSSVTLTIKATGCADKTVVVPPPAACPVFDLALKKTLAAGQAASVTPGSSVKFTVTVYNQGNVDATAIQVSDYIPTGLTLADANWTVSNGIATLNTPIATLAAGTNTTRDITFIVNAGVTGALTNTTEISSAKDANGNTPTDVDSTPDNNPNNDGTPKNDVTNENGKTGGDEDDSDPEVIIVTTAPIFDLALKKTLATGQATTVNPGDKVTFTITVYNQGNVTASAIQVTDYIPTGLVFNAADNPSWALGSNSLATTTLPGTLAAGVSTTVNIVLQVASTYTGTGLVNKAEISSAKDGNGNTVTDKDSTPDQSPANDAGGKENSASDDATGGNGTGTPGSNDPATDEDDEDPALITVDQCIHSQLVAGVVMSPKVIRTQNDVVQITFALTNPGSAPLSGVNFIGQVKAYNISNSTPVTLTLTKQGDSGNDGIMQPNESWLYTGSFSSTYTPGTVFIVTGEATASCGSTSVKTAAADLLYTVGVNMDVAIKDNCYRPGSKLEVDFVTRLLIDEDIAQNPGSITLGGTTIALPKRRFEARGLMITIQGINNNQPFDPFNPPAGINLTKFTDQSADAGRNTNNILDEADPINTYRAPCTALGQDDVGCEFPDWVFHLQVPVPAGYTGNTFSVTASDQFQLFQSVEDPAGSGTFTAFEDITPQTGAGGADTDIAPVCSEMDLALKKTLATGQTATVSPGNTVKFTITVYNQGGVDATAIQVSDYIPTGLTLSDANWTVSNGIATLNTSIASLAAGASTTRDITFTVNAGVTGTITNTAEISSVKDNNGNPATDIDSTPDNNPNNDGTPKNDVTNENGKTGGDEDDSDPETITITPLCVKPILTAGNSVCNGSTYSVVFYSSVTNVTASAGTLTNGSVTGIPVGTNVTLTATQAAGCVTTLTVQGPTSCQTNPGCVLPSLIAGQPICNGNATYSVSFYADRGTISVNVGTVGINRVDNVPVGTALTITATEGTCISRVTVSSPVNCNTVCENPALSLSGPICSANGTAYSLNYVLSSGASVTSSAGTINNGSITGIPVGTAITLTVKVPGCTDKTVIIPPVYCTPAKVDLHLKKLISKKQAKVGDVIEYTVKVWNESSTPANGVVVSDSLNRGVQYISSTATRGSYTPTTYQWNIGTIGANGDTVTLTLRVKLVAQGVWFNTAEVSKTNEEDVDSTPGNGNEGEDDIDHACVSVPITLCTGEKVQAGVPAQYTGVTWYKDGSNTPIATGNVVLFSEVGTYTYRSISTACPAEGCCPIIIEPATNCCPVDICIPFTIIKRKKK